LGLSAGDTARIEIRSSQINDFQKNLNVTAGRLTKLQNLVRANLGAAGKNWSRQSTKPTDALFAVHFRADGKTGWAVGWNGTIRTTIDGGDIWTAQDSGTNEDLYAAHFQADGRTGWAVGQSGTILRSVGPNFPTEPPETVARLIKFLGTFPGTKSLMVVLLPQLKELHEDAKETEQAIEWENGAKFGWGDIFARPLSQHKEWTRVMSLSTCTARI
jgi:hypothetical protein